MDIFILVKLAPMWLCIYHTCVITLKSGIIVVIISLINSIKSCAVPNDPWSILFHCKNKPTGWYKWSIIPYLQNAAKSLIPIYWKPLHKTMVPKRVIIYTSLKNLHINFTSLPLAFVRYWPVGWFSKPLLLTWILWLLVICNVHSFVAFDYKFSYGLLPIHIWDQISPFSFSNKRKHCIRHHYSSDLHQLLSCLPISCPAALWTHSACGPFRDCFFIFPIKAVSFDWTRWGSKKLASCSQPHPIRECFPFF